MYLHKMKTSKQKWLPSIFRMQYSWELNDELANDTNATNFKSMMTFLQKSSTTILCLCFGCDQKTSISRVWWFNQKDTMTIGNIWVVMTPVHYKDGDTDRLDVHTPT